MKNPKTHLPIPCMHSEYDIEFERQGDFMFFKITCRVCEKGTPWYGAAGVDFAKPDYGIPQRAVI